MPIKTSQNCTLVACEQECESEVECIGYDYTRNCKSESCRLYKINKARTDPGGDERLYCAKGSFENHMECFSSIILMS